MAPEPSNDATRHDPRWKRPGDPDPGDVVEDVYAIEGEPYYRLVGVDTGTAGTLGEGEGSARNYRRALRLVLEGVEGDDEGQQGAIVVLLTESNVVDLATRLLLTFGDPKLLARIDQQLTNYQPRTPKDGV